MNRRTSNRTTRSSPGEEAPDVTRLSREDSVCRGNVPRPGWKRRAKAQYCSVKVGCTLLGNNEPLNPKSVRHPERSEGPAFSCTCNDIADAEESRFLASLGMTHQFTQTYSPTLLAQRYWASAQYRQSLCYFCCSDAIYFVRLRTRSCATPSLVVPIARKIGPQTGISLDPWLETGESPLMAWDTRLSGKVPRFLADSCVKSAGTYFIADAAGPSPFPSLP